MKKITVIPQLALTVGANPAAEPVEVVLNIAGPNGDGSFKAPLPPQSVSTFQINP